ncbi:MAG: helix-turn-helix domain-containing protein [Bacteroidota bacterium]
MARKIIENPNVCSIVHAMNIIGGKWKPIILYLLSNGSLRFGKLLIFTPTISRKVLTDQLRELEEDGLIIRTKYAELPPRVEYSLSKKGIALLPILKMISDWTVENFEDIEFEACRIITGE